MSANKEQNRWFSFGMFQPLDWLLLAALSLATVGLIIPTIFHLAADRQPGGWSGQSRAKSSMAIAAVLFLTTSDSR